MYITRIGTTPRRRPPIPGGPTIEVPVAVETSTSSPSSRCGPRLAGGLPEHDHRPSEVVLAHLSGSIKLQQGEQLHRLAPGGVAHIAAGKRVSLTNPGTEPAVMMIVASRPRIRRANLALAGRLGPSVTAPPAQPEPATVTRSRKQHHRSRRNS
jgi:hypothetical protein